MQYYIIQVDEWPFPSSLVPLFQSESKCKTIVMKMTDLHQNETACRTHFHMKGFALRLVLRQRYKRTRKWPIMPKIPENFGRKWQGPFRFFLTGILEITSGGGSLIRCSIFDKPVLLP